MSRQALAFYAVVAAAGFAAGLADYLTAQGRRQALVHHHAANAIAVHVALAACLALFLIAGHVVSRPHAAPGRDRSTLRWAMPGFWKWPFTERGWQRTLFSLLAAPVCFAQLLLTIVGQVQIARRMEAWRRRPFQCDTTSRHGNGQGRTSVARCLTRVLFAIVLSAATLAAFFSVFRAAFQVSSFRASGNVNAWGGPTYLGALLAHWLDSFIGFYASVLIVRGLAR